MNRVVKRCVSIVVTALLCGGAIAQTVWPAKPVRFQVGFSAGGSADLVARLLAEELRPVWGQPILVENRVGAGGAIAADMVAKAPPDGYVLLVTTASHTALGALKKQLPYNSVSDFTPINLFASAPNALVTRSDSPLRTLPAFIAAAKAKPGEVSYATSGVGGILNFAGEQFAHAAGIKLNHVPYKGANDVVLGVLSGSVQSSWSVVSAAIPLVAPDKLHIVAVASDKRSALVPDVPTLAELGVKVSSETWFGVLGPANLPPEITTRINDSLQKLLASPDVRAKLVKFGAEPRGLGPTEFSRLVKSELEQFAAIAKIANITAE